MSVGPPGIGTIMKVTTAPVGSPWLWTRAFGQHKGDALWEGWVPLARLSHFGYTPPAIINNMGLLKVDPSKVQALIVSHGHSDHHGGP